MTHRGITLKRRLFPLLLAACSACATTTTTLHPEASMSTIQPPRAKQIPYEHVTHDHARPDPWHWLRDDDRDDPEMLAYLAEENTYKDAVLAHTKDLQDELFEEIKGRIKKDDSTVPARLNGYWYYARFEKGKEYPIHCRRKGSRENPEEIILDVNELAKGHAYYSAASLRISDDGTLLAWSEDTVSRRIYTIRFKNLTTNEVLSDSIEGTAGMTTWGADNETLFYVVRDPQTLRAHAVKRHSLGQSTATDVLVFDETDDTFHVGVGKTRDRKFVVIAASSTLVSECQVIDARSPSDPPRIFLPREANHEYQIGHANGAFYVRSNWDAVNFRLMKADLQTSADKSTWEIVVPGSETTFLHDFDLFEDHLVLTERKGGLQGIRVLPWADPDGAFDMDFGQPIYVAGLAGNPEFKTNTLRYDFESMTTPTSIYDYDYETGSKKLMKRDEVLGGFDADDYVGERIIAKSQDGTDVHISIVHRKDLDRTKPQPLYEYGYGSYGYSMDPWFSAARLSLLDRGFIYAIAHIRGGQENGRRWYEDGKLLKKKNTFTDFVDCGRHLIEEGYTSPDLLIGGGGSAGGLLVGAVANMAPTQYKVIVAHVPFVDVVSTMLDETIPLTTFEYDEWGNPNDEEYYHYMLSYSPYDQVKAQAYPHMLIMTGLHDSQVQYWEPAKWAAKLRATATGDNLVLFHTNMEAGHGGASGRFRKYRELALEYAFLIDVMKTETAP